MNGSIKLTFFRADKRVVRLSYYVVGDRTLWRTRIYDPDRPESGFELSRVGDMMATLRSGAQVFGNHKRWVAFPVLARPDCEN